MKIEGPLKNENRGSAQFLKKFQVLACYLKRFIVTPARVRVRVCGEGEAEGKVEGECEG